MKEEKKETASASVYLNFLVLNFIVYMLNLLLKHYMWA